MTRLRVALLGCGGIARRHAAAAGALRDEMALVACCGRDPGRTRAFASEFQVDPFTDLDAMLDRGVDLLIVALPPYVRAGEIEHAAARGTHLLVEKPIAIDTDAAATMVQAVEASGVVAAAGFMYRFGEAVNRWEAADTGLLGLFTGSYHCNALHAPWWRERSKSGGQMVEQVIHLIDLVRHLMGTPDRVHARAANLFHRQTPGYDAEDMSAILFGWDDGRTAVLTASNFAERGLWQKEWSLFAARMTGRFSDWNNALFTATVGEASEERIAAMSDPFVAQLADLACAIQTRRAPKVPLREGLETLRLALLARRSADEGRPLGIQDAV